MYVVFFFTDRQVILLLSATLSNKTCGKLIFPAIWGLYLFFVMIFII